MKINSILFLCLMMFATVSFAQGGDEAAPAGAKFDWTEGDNGFQHDFGKIPQGVPASHEYWFTNTGTDTLVISNVKKTCGCTTPAWTKDPIPPGEKGYIKATYNAAAMGKFHKAVIVTSNAEPKTFQLFLKGEVLGKDAIDVTDDSLMKNKPEGGQ